MRGTLRASLVEAMLFVALLPVAAPGQQTAVVEVDFKNEGVTPSNWKITLNSDGSGQFDSWGGHAQPQDSNLITAGEVHRPIQLGKEFTDHVFEIARKRKLFAFSCESHMKVAFQGSKRLSYSGPEGSGSCEFNYSKDKEIQGLGDSMMALETTVQYGARLEKLLQHDRLGLDHEMENLATAAHDGNAVELGVIHDTLARIASDEQVLERARRKARLLMAQPD